MKRNNIRSGFIVAAALSVGTACTVIEDGEVGVTKSFGVISDDPVPQGLAMVFPVVREVEVWNVKLQEVKEQAQVPSSEGLIVVLDTSLLFQVQKEAAPEIRKTIGSDFMGTLIKPYFRNSVRDVVSGYQVKNIYSEEGRKQIAGRVKARLAESLSPRGVEVIDVLLRDVQLPQKFKQSIEAKLTAEQKAEQKRFELEQAKRDAEIEIARAEGAAKAQEIVRSTLSESYLQYLWIKTLNDNPNVIYVATEANVPLFKRLDN
jgi:regulator of protease activity HflC (stomatin/prohibitin superfamily)